MYIDQLVFWSIKVKLYEYRACFLISQLPSPISLPTFISFLLLSPYLVTAVTLISPSCHHLCSYSLMTYNNTTIISYTHSHHHHHHIVLAARISLTLSRHSSLSFIALGRSSGQQPVSSHSCWMYVRAGRPAFARPCVGINKSTSLMSSSLLLQQCPACLVRLTWIIFLIGGRWPYSWCLVGCCCQDLFRIARSILV